MVAVVLHAAPGDNVRMMVLVIFEATLHDRLSSSLNEFGSTQVDHISIRLFYLTSIALMHQARLSVLF